MEHTSAISAQRLIGPLAFLDVIYQHVHRNVWVALCGNVWVALCVKESAYKGLVRPVLEYGGSVWDPSSILLQEKLKKLQKRAAGFVTGNYIYET